MAKSRILSFSVNDTIRTWIRRLIKKKIYKNQSTVIRDALTRLMDDSTLESKLNGGTYVPEVAPKPVTNYHTGVVTVVCPKREPGLRRNLKKIERQWTPNIKVKQMTNDATFRTIVYTFEGNLSQFQKFTTAINSIDELKNLRYLIVK